ncbi:hypothetical protein J4Q44_G00246800, partial [Coregonus suidteri]
MNPADLDSVHHAITHQEKMLGHHSTVLQEIALSVRNLSTSLTEVQNQRKFPVENPLPVSPFSSAASGAVSFREPKVPTP